MNILKSIFDYLGDATRRHRQKKANERKELVRRDLYNRVQVMEFGGELYISYDGVPIVRRDDLCDTIEHVVNDSRLTVMAFNECE